MRTLEFTLICVYFYITKILRNPGYAILLMALLFITHKLGTWLTWALTLTV